MEITAIDIFEEVRFILELLAGELVFLIPFTQMKRHFLRKAVCLIIVYTIASLLYFPILKAFALCAVPTTLVSSWYIIFALATLFFCKSLFEIGTVDGLYVIASAYALQHLVYVTVHEALALYYWTYLRMHLFLYVSVSVTVSFIWYFIVYLVFTRKLKECNGKLYEDSFFLIVFYLIFISIMLMSTFSAQHLFQVGDDIRNFGIIWGVSTSILILGIQYANFKSTVATREQAIISRILQDSATHYTISKELIDLVNRNAHDLKHQLKALKNAPDDLKNDFINEQMSHIEEYQNLVFCDNEVLNTILAEKSLYCSSQGITFSCSIKKANLDSIDVMDLYALLGNAIDNAIECVTQFEDDNKKVISVNVSSKNAFTIFQVENYSHEITSTIDELPTTTKNDLGHGFGLKSIKYIAKKYDGNMYWANNDGIFSLQIMIPTPTMPR